MRILDRYLIREMILTWLAVLSVLLVIMIGNVLGRSLSRVTEGSVAADMLLTLVAVKSVTLLVTLIPLSLYLGIMLAQGRFYRDNEMTVMQACGVGWGDLMRPAAVVGIIGVISITVLTVWVSPWAYRYEQALLVNLEEESGVRLLTPGRFMQFRHGELVFFVHEASEDRTQFRDVFMYRSREGQVPAVDSARLATWQVDEDNGNEYLVFTDGQTSIGEPGSGEYTLTDFETQGVLRPDRNHEVATLRARAKTFPALWADGSLGDLAEIQWRISIPLAALLLALLAVPLAYTSPRQGRFGKVAVAILLYIPYANLLVLMRKWIAAGTVPSWIGLWPVHLAVVVLILWLFAKRNNVSLFGGGAR